MDMSFEFQILDFLQTLHTPAADVLMKAVSALGNAGMIWIVLTVVLLAVPKTRKTGALLAAALVLDVILCNGILKHLVARTRPFDVNTAVELLVKRPADYSFPSGHTTASFASVAVLYYAGERRLWIPASVLAVLIAFSRMYLYVHYPTDVLGGIALGIFCGWLAKRLLVRSGFWERAADGVRREQAEEQ